MERKRLTKERFHTMPRSLTLNEMLLNSGDYNGVGDLMYWHLTDCYDAIELVKKLYDEYNADTVWEVEIEPYEIRDVFMNNLVHGLDTPDGLLANFYWLIESNAELRKRLKEYEDKEFGEETYYIRRE